MKLILLWHQHQPPYTDPHTGKQVMPWVRLHALKDYVDMVQTVLDAPAGARVVVNLTPTLLEQIDAVVADPDTDELLALCRRDPRTLSAVEAAELDRELFSVHPDTMLHPYPAYRALWETRQATLRAGGRGFTDQERLDLIVWFHLAWSGVALRKEPLVQHLLAKERDFDLSEKDALLGLQQAFLARVVPIHRAAAEQGRVEVITSAWHHPILPLLCATEAATDAEPDCPLPNVRFSYPQDAERHLEAAVASHRSRFGTPPVGMWPPEGAVSEAAVELIGRQKVQWVATDEAILARSTGHHGSPDQPWRFGEVTIFFRDHELSDRIGFVYSRWEPEHAAADFLAGLRERAARSSLDDPLITVALDGENAWEHFAGGGYGFLAALYRTLAEAPDVEMVLPAEWLETNRAPALPRLAAGTWIDGSFRTWIGDPVKNRAWELLSDARSVLADAAPSEARDTAMEAMLCAEASDWFWWFGHGHSSSHDAQFDRLFRTYVGAVYRALDVAIPDSLRAPLDGEGRAEAGEQPQRCGRPTVTGTRTPYYKWANAARWTLQQGSIHRFDPLIEACWAIYDARILTLRLDAGGDARAVLSGDRRLELVIDDGAPRHVAIYPVADDAVVAAVGSIVEVAIPLPQSAHVRLYWRILADQNEVERFPWVGDLSLTLRPSALDLENWVV